MTRREELTLILNHIRLNYLKVLRSKEEEKLLSVLILLLLSTKIKVEEVMLHIVGR